MTKLIGISGALRKASTNTGLLRALKDLAPLIPMSFVMPSP